MIPSIELTELQQEKADIILVDYPDTGEASYIYFWILPDFAIVQLDESAEGDCTVMLMNSDHALARLKDYWDLEWEPETVTAQGAEFLVGGGLAEIYQAYYEHIAKK